MNFSAKYSLSRNNSVVTVTRAHLISAAIAYRLPFLSDGIRMAYRNAESEHGSLLRSSPL